MKITLLCAAAAISLAGCAMEPTVSTASGAKNPALQPAGDDKAFYTGSRIPRKDLPAEYINRIDREAADELRDRANIMSNPRGG